MAVLVNKVLHLCITVPDLDEAVGFYQGVLGFESIFQTDNGAADGALLGLQTPEVSLAARHLVAAGSAHDAHATEINIVEYPAHKATVDENPPNQTDRIGLSRLALLVEDVDQAFSQLRCHPGVEIICAPRDIVINDAGTPTTSRWFSFRDPFGVFITATAQTATREGPDRS